ncbi:MAG: hypothetical protein OXN17_19380 [Candidatus Poribacteria bacterium]|nr:hypothetical protein [Candidatus Poribacteria bacterium]MDE0506692.1 hypothetical protein [Candidatus Poribacteria bacterium]
MPTHIDLKAILFVAALIGVSACASMKDLGQSLDGGGIEQVEGEDWKTVKKMKKTVDAATRIDINRRTEAIRVVQFTWNFTRKSRDHVTDFEVYVQKK